MTIRWVEFPLHPETPLDGRTLEDLFAGRNVNIDTLMKLLKKTADENDLPFGDRKMTFNSRRAQELGKWAESLEKRDAFDDAAFRAYFVDGLNIAEIPVLMSVIRSAGMDTGEAERVLREGRFKGAVDRDWAYSRECGITAVPTFMIGELGAVGAQPYETLERLVLAAGARPRGSS